MNGTTTHCYLKQGSKMGFNSNTLIEFTKVSCSTFMRNTELRLLNSRKKNFFKRFFICISYHFNQHNILHDGGEFY